MFIAIAALTFAGLVIFIVRNKLYKKISFKSTPILLPMIILSLAFLLNGVFSSKWVISNLTVAFANITAFCLVFIIIYHGFSKEETAEDIMRYFSFISLLISIVIIAELCALFLTNPDIVIGGSINKVEVALGWGIWNLIGVSLSVLVPVIFYGMEVNRYPFAYFVFATLAYIASILTMSRNALIFSSLTYFSSLVIFCFKGKFKLVMRIILVAGILFVSLFAIVFWDKISELLADYLNRGFSDSGRFALWRAAFENFKENFLFGAGFCGLDVETDVFGPLVKQAHNTVFQLLSATGIVGLLAYAYYRFESLRGVFKKPSLMKTMLFISIMALLLGSLLDNFIFNIYPMFYYSVALALIHKNNNETRTKVND